MRVTPPPDAPSGIASVSHRLARDLHDGLAQELWLAKIAAARLVRDQSLRSDQRTVCRELHDAVDRALAEVRTAIAAMSGTSDESPSFTKLIVEEVAEFGQRFGIRATCRVAEGLHGAMEPREGVELVRIVQEALNNVRKHADAGRVNVDVRERAGSLVVTVRDDGRGFDPATVTDGYGLASMRDRARAIGGRATVTSLPEGGTVVTVQAPLERRVPG